MQTLDPGLLERETLDKLLGVEYRELTQARVVATLRIEPRHHQPFGYMHGGVTLSMAESVASVGAVLNCPPGRIAMGLELNANHLRPKREGTLTAIGVPLHIGRSTQVWEVKIYDESDKLVCVSRCTLAVVEP